MKTTAPITAAALIDRLAQENPNNTRIRSIAKKVGIDHEISVELWNNGSVTARMLSILTADRRKVDSTELHSLVEAVEDMDEEQQSKLCGWLVANLIMKKAGLRKEAAGWRSSPSTIRQRIFWSVMARSVKGENHYENDRLLEHIERDLSTADGSVQWNMNWCAAQIGIADSELRARCVELGKLGLYVDYPVSRGCTSPFLPEWINSVVAKQQGS